jgi:DNA-binding transcriptional LysR family regulator
MEMHQIRYFLAVSRTLNFTRAAEECNVTQPSLTRAIKHLEDELGGELLRRERVLSHLTELGQRVLPLLQQSYDSAQAAKELARSLKSGDQGSLSVSVSRGVNLELFSGAFRELSRARPTAQLRLGRARASEIADSLKKGETELAVATSLGDEWERFDRWPLFKERIDVVANPDHALSGRNAIDLSHLAGERFLVQEDVELPDDLAGFLGRTAEGPVIAHRVSSDQDLIPLLRADLGIAFMPTSALVPEGLRRVPLRGGAYERTVAAYGVAGRRRSPVATTFLNLLRATDWSRHVH